MASLALLMYLVHGLPMSAQVLGINQQHDSLMRSEGAARSGASKIVMDARGAMEVNLHHHGPQQPKASMAFVKKSFPFYHSTDEIKSEALRLSKGCSGMLKFKTIKDGNVSLDVVTVRKASAKPLNKVFIIFGEHSRELISPESGLYFMRTLCGDAQLSASSLLETGSAEDVLDKSEFQMVLNANPRSRRKVEGGDYCLRTNPSGVDLNRNWDEHFERESASFGTSSNPGPKPFSEPETRILKQLVTDYAPTTFLTVHSGTRGMYMPWAYDMQHLADYNEPLMMDILKSIDRNHCQCPFGAAGKEVGYPCPGTCLDYAYGKLKTPFAFAFEIYTSPSSDDDLKKRWEDKINNGGGALLEKGHHLAHPHFRDFFSEHTSDFVDVSSNSAARVQRQQGAVDPEGGAELDAADSSDSSFPTHYDQEQENNSCFDLFNPGTQEDYHKVVKNWAEAYLQMSNLIAQKILKGEVPKRNITTPVQ